MKKRPGMAKKTFLKTKGSVNSGKTFKVKARG